MDAVTPAIASLAALLLVIAASFTARVNIGVLSIALAWPIAVFGAGWTLDALAAAFPSSLFVTLLGVTLLFGAAQANGTLGAVSAAGIRLLNGHAAMVPLLLFVLAGAVSSLGPGALAATALMAPLAMTLAARAGVPMLLAALMIGNGANAGNLSPFSAVGVIVQSSMIRAELGGHALTVFLTNFSAHALAAAAAWLLFGGRALRSAPRVHAPVDPAPFTGAHAVTIATIGAWIASVLLLHVNPGFAAFAATAVLVLTRQASDTAALQQVPWSVIVMVCGVSVLVAVLEKTGGMELFSSLLARVATPASINAVIAFVTGVISTFSSTSGVVYPAFLPAVPSLVQKLGGGDPLQVALSINVGAALVDVSPLSTIGALCIAALPHPHDPKVLFRQLLLWGFAMTLAAAVFCQLAVPLFAAAGS